MPTVHEDTYTQVPTAALLDPRLSLKAKGLLGIILSIPKGSSRNLEHLETLSKDGHHATRRAFQELESHGYVSRRRLQHHNGFYLGWEYLVHMPGRGSTGEHS